MLGEKPPPRFPISATWPVEQNNRNNPCLARLHQSEDLESFVHRAEPAGKKREGV